MQIRRYAGSDEKELLKRIRADLGPDAVILHSAYERQKGLLRFFGRPRLEIVAGGGFKIVKEMIRCTEGIALKPGRCVKVAFVGPTGVGKTTTIAKLISIYAHKGKEVAVITNDTYRIAAAEQIRRVAQLVGVPIRVCPRP